MTLFGRASTSRTPMTDSPATSVAICSGGHPAPGEITGPLVGGRRTGGPGESPGLSACTQKTAGQPSKPPRVTVRLRGGVSLFNREVLLHTRYQLRSARIQGVRRPDATGDAQPAPGAAAAVG